MGDRRVYHSVTLDRDRCMGCTNCIKRCPTEAIRVREGKALIISERCIDCGECIRLCPHHAKKAVYDRRSDFDGKFQYTVALPAPSLYGQFNNLDDVDYVLTGLKHIGFDDVFEVATAAEIVSDYTRRILAGKTALEVKRPMISTACPAVVRLIQVKFPDLLPNLLPVLTPAELAGKLAKREAAKKTGLSPSEIGTFFISPCPAKVTSARTPIGMHESYIDGVLSMSSVYKKLVSAMNKITEPEPLSHSGIVGISWASSGGEAAALLRDKYLAADGIENVKKVLEELEDDRLPECEFVELNACISGCVGGALAFETPFIAKTRLQILRRCLPVSRNAYNAEELREEELHWEKGPAFNPALLLDDDFGSALHKRRQIDEIEAQLPGLDCGSCGAPSCRALAEDIVRGSAKETDCIFILRRKVFGMYQELSNFDNYGPRDKE